MEKLAISKDANNSLNIYFPKTGIIRTLNFLSPYTLCYVRNECKMTLLFRFYVDSSVTMVSDTTLGRLNKYTYVFIMAVLFCHSWKLQCRKTQCSIFLIIGFIQIDLVTMGGSGIQMQLKSFVDNLLNNVQISFYNP